MPRLPPELLHAGTYATSAELGFAEPRTDAEIGETLGHLSAYDCMSVIGRLSAWYYTTGKAPEPRSQVHVLRWAGTATGASGSRALSTAVPSSSFRSS